jgi:broad specificity phosphatase PhoE
MIQGQLDIPLNARGRRQAEALAGRLSRVPLEVIYTSDLSRANETAGMVAARQPGEIPLVATPELRELDYGLWEGLTRSEVAMRFTEDWRTWNKGGRIGSPTGGEDALSLAKRAGRAFDAAVREGKTVLISTHRVTLRTILCHALGLEQTSRNQFAVMNCSLSALECHPEYRPRLILLNDTCHMDGMEI